MSLRKGDGLGNFARPGQSGRMQDGNRLVIRFNNDFGAGADLLHQGGEILSGFRFRNVECGDGSDDTPAFDSSRRKARIIEWQWRG